MPTILSDWICGAFFSDPRTRARSRVTETAPIGRLRYVRRACLHMHDYSHSLEILVGTVLCHRAQVAYKCAEPFSASNEGMGYPELQIAAPAATARQEC